MQTIRPKGIHFKYLNNLSGKKETTIVDKYQRKMELLMLKGSKTVATCTRCNLYYRRAASSNLCRKCRVE